MRAIVVGTDGSAGAEKALRRAIAIAAATDAPLHVVTAYPGGSHSEPLMSSARTTRIDLREVAEGVLARHAGLAQSDGVRAETHAREGDPAEVLIDVAEEVAAELIVVGARGLTGLARWLLGSVSTKLSNYASCDVMIVR